VFDFDSIESPRVDQVITRAESLTESGPLAVQHYESALQRMLQVIAYAIITFFTLSHAFGCLMLFSG
jgi:hypothetical protein